MKKVKTSNVKKAKLKTNTGPSCARSNIVNLKSNNEEPQDEKKKKTR